MKKRYHTLRLLLFAGQLLLTTQLFAQQGGSPYYGFRLGLTAHPTLGWVSPEVGKSNGLALGFAYGLLADFNFADNYAFATGLTITTINGKSTEINARPYFTGSGSDQVAYELRYRLQYVEVPLTVKLKTNKIGDLRWYGQFGLSNDFNIGAKQNAVSKDNKVNDQNISDYTRFYRAGLIVGAGAEYDLDTSTSLAIGLTFNNGFTNITSDKNRSVKNHYVGINIGVFF